MLEPASFQRVVTIAAAVPGLVAAIFGANVDFPGRESTDAFWAMLLIMAGGGIGSYVGAADELLAKALAPGSWPQAKNAERFLTEGKLDRVLALYRQAMRLDPNEPAYPRTSPRPSTASASMVSPSAS